jgi:hypothetical protein
MDAMLQAAGRVIPSERDQTRRRHLLAGPRARLMQDGSVVVGLRRVERQG